MRCRRLGVQGRIGVDTGEVVTGTAERLATGDAVNVAARLQQAAAPGEVLIGAQTRALVRDAVEVDRARAVGAQGQAGAGCRVPAAGGRAGARPVGRRALRRSHARAGAAAGGVGARGRGQSLRARHDRGRGGGREVAAGGGARRRASRRESCAVAVSPTARGSRTGRWSEVIKQLGALPPDPGARGGDRSRCWARATRARRPTRSRGRSAKLLEQEAPLVVVVDDIQWGEETLARPAGARRPVLGGCAAAAAVHRAAGARRAPSGVAGGAEARAAAAKRTSRRCFRRRCPSSCASGSRAPRAAIRSSSRR